MYLDGSYSLEDFLLFSDEVYWRLFEVHNAEFRFVVPLALLGTALLSYALLSSAEGPRRAAVLVAGAAWVFLSWAFFWVSYAPVNWAAVYVAPLFAAEGLLLFLLSRQQTLWSFGTKGLKAVAGRALALYGLLIYPLQGLAAGRPVEALQLFGLAPDPTALATLGLLAAVGRGWLARICSLAPVIWCLLSATTLYALGSWEAWPLAAAVLLALAVILPRHTPARA